MGRIGKELSWRTWRVLLLGFLLPLPAVAWNAAGHRLVACVAWDQLDQQQRDTVSRLLRRHPDYERWRHRGGAEQADRAAFIEASTWPDEIRQDRRFYDLAEDAPTTTLAGFPDMERRRNWHYVTPPRAATPDSMTPPPARPESPAEGRIGQLDRQLVVLARTLGSAEAPQSERSYALPWLIHLTGDAHQPLHTSQEREVGTPDHAEDGPMVINPFNPRRRVTTLHGFWDDLPGPPWLRGEQLDVACRALTTRYPRPAPSSSGQWIEESRQIARSRAYPPRGDPVTTITAEFYESARQIASQRITQAGYRLADLLTRLPELP